MTTTPTLKTERHTRTMERRVLTAARAALPGRRGRLVADFEHGQWWITDRVTGGQWSVVDAEPTAYGFDFEPVTPEAEG